MALRNVDFPAPLGPMTPTSCPLSARRFTLSSSVSASILKNRPCALIAGGGWPFIVRYSARLKLAAGGSVN